MFFHYLFVTILHLIEILKSFLTLVLLQHDSKISERCAIIFPEVFNFRSYFIPQSEIIRQTLPHSKC